MINKYIIVICLLNSRFISSYNINRVKLQLTKQITKIKNINCHYCNGYGYIKCKCKNGCWKCNNTTFEKCPICGGDGKGRFAYNFFTLKKINSI